MRERVIWVAAVLVLLAVLAPGRRDSHGAAASNRPRAQPGVRLSMNALHQQGGVPIGWQMMPAPGDVAAGRQAFVDFGCPSCHRVAGEAFSDMQTGSSQGPELSGMGGHHPPAYFAEAILNPDAVLIVAASSLKWAFLTWVDRLDIKASKRAALPSVHANRPSDQ